MAPRRVPQRTCVGCRGISGKDELVRVVRTSESIVVDRKGRVPGRGAYVHRMPGCVDLAFKRRAFDRALRARVSAEEAARLRADLEREVGPR